MGIARAAVLALSLTLLLGTVQPHAEIGSDNIAMGTMHADLASGAPGMETVRHSYWLRTDGLTEQTAASGTLPVQLDADLVIHLRLQERSIFAPGEKKVQYFDEQGTLIREEPILARTFLGRVVETSERAEVTLAPEGIYGAVWHHGVEYSLQPLSWENGLVLQEVVHDAVAFEAPPLPVGEPSPEADVKAAVVTYNLYVKPVAEPSFRNWASDWANRITNAYFYAESMWESETGIQQVLYSAAAPASDFSSGSNSCGTSGSKDLGLTEFRNWIFANGGTGINAYGLWHGADGVADQAGCSQANCDGTPSGCLQQYSATFPRTSAEQPSRPRTSSARTTTTHRAPTTSARLWRTN